MSFTQVFEQLDWSSISMDIMSKTDMDVRRALAKPKPDLEDFKALISPAAEPYLEQMAQMSYSKNAPALWLQCRYVCSPLSIKPLC